MQLRTRLVLMVAGSVSLGIVAVASVLTLLAWRSILTQADMEGLVIARLLAQSATVSEQVVSEVGSLLDHEMVAQGLLTSHLADLADIAGVSDKMLSRRLMEITARSSIGELWISDAHGKVRASSADDSDDPESVAAAAGLPEASLTPLLSGTEFSEPLGVARQPLGGLPMRYMGVRGVDSPRVVLVGRDQSYVTQLNRTLGVQRLLDVLARDGRVEALWVFGPTGKAVASSFDTHLPMPRTLSAQEMHLVDSALNGMPAKSIVSDGWISVAAAMPDAYGLPAGAALARLSTAPLDQLLTEYFRIGGGMALASLLVGVLLSVIMGRRIAAPMMRIAEAAASVDARSFVAGSLGEVAARRDELGYLARTFEVMAEQVLAREEELERQVRERTMELLLKNEQLDQAKRRLEADLELARLLQATILPQAFPADRGWSGTARMMPALQMAGDFYDYFPLDDNRLGLVIADVSGKGVAPAFFMAVSRSALREAARNHDDPGDCLTAANDRLCDQNPLDMFVTVFYAVIDARAGTVVYANGGHNRPYHMDAKGQPTSVPLTGGMMLGVMPGMPYQSATMTLQPGETLFLYTDGVSEAMNQASEEFGERRLEAVLTQSAHLPVEDVLSAVTAAVHDFAGSAPQSDDITCLVVRYVGGRIEYAPKPSQ
jgi:sigma-B regulation protein RsbU (phosphoserine phosphatase)